MTDQILDGPTPLYKQLESILRDKIAEGIFRPGEPLPTEQELMESYALSRTTVREALKRLASDQSIIKVQGKGTFVSQPAIQQELLNLRTISEVLTGAGFIPEVRVLDVDLSAEFPPHVLVQLQIGADDRVIRIRRQHFVEGEPIAYAVIYLSKKFNWRFSSDDLGHQSIYSWLESKTDIVVESGFQMIRAMPAKPEVAEALNLEPGTAILHVENTSHSPDGIPIEHTEFYFPPERYALTISLRRSQGGVTLEDVQAGYSERDNSDPQEDLRKKTRAKPSAEGFDVQS